MAAIASERAPLSQLVRTPYIQVVTYPRISLRVAKARIKQLQKLGVQELVFQGRARLGRLGLLGIGTVGVVVAARTADNTYALKIRRTDANRQSMEEEFRLTAFANKLGIGPVVVGRTKDFLLMELLDYVELHEWFKALGGPGTRAKAREMLHRLLNQCRKLDIMGLDHGQLSNLRKHAVVSAGGPRIMDFESASLNRRPRNVTTAAQYLLVGGRTSPLVRRLVGLKETGALLGELRAYKLDQNDFHYSQILGVLGVPGS